MSLGSSNLGSEILSWDRLDRFGAPVRPANPYFAQFTADLGVGASTRRRAGEAPHCLSGAATSPAKPRFVSPSPFSRPREASRWSRAAARLRSSCRPSRRRSSGPSHPEAHPPHPAPPQLHHGLDFALPWPESRQSPLVAAALNTKLRPSRRRSFSVFPRLDSR